MQQDRSPRIGTVELLLREYVRAHPKMVTIQRDYFHTLLVENNLAYSSELSRKICFHLVLECFSCFAERKSRQEVR